MANLNKVFLIGNLARDPELRYIPSGTAVATFTVATGRSYTLASGEKREETCFARVVVWGRRAEVCGEYLSKGSPVFVEGRLQSRSWETPEGQKRSVLEVVAQNVQFLGKLPKGADEVTRPEEVSESPSSQAAPDEAQVSSSGDAGGSPEENLGEEVPF